MRIDRCKGCGEHVNIASDHAPGCTRRATSQVIPEAAVEAAAKVVADHTGYGWVSEDDREIARNILEAAAPHMLAEVEADREELFEIISNSFYSEHVDPSGHTADAIIAAGYRKASHGND